MNNLIRNKRHLREVGQRLRALRTEKDLSQRDLASRGISYAYISRLEAGTRTPSLSALIELGDRLGTSGLYLLTGNHNEPCPFCHHPGKSEASAATDGRGDPEAVPRPARSKRDE